MTTTFAEKPTDTHKHASTPADICAELSGFVETCQTSSAFYRQAIRAIAGHFQAPYAILRVTGSANTLEERFRLEPEDEQQWESVVQAALLECQTDRQPIARVYSVDGSSVIIAVLAVLVHDHAGRTQGAVSLVTACEAPALAKAYLAELQALVAMAGTRATQIGTANEPKQNLDHAAKSAVAKSAGFESLHEMAFAVTNGLKSKFNCDQVVLGFVKQRRVQILAISGLDDICEKSPGVKHIREAMHECLDRGRAICCQSEGTWSDDLGSTNFRLHRRWHQAVGEAPVASIPLYSGHRCVAVVSMLRDKQARFSSEELAKIEETVTPFAPALLLVARATRGLLAHAVSAVRNGVAWLLARRTYQRKVVAAVLVAFIAVFCLASTDYQVTVPSQVAPTEIRYFAAPFQGAIAACHVEIGDDVSQGQLLCELDTTDLRLQLDQLMSEIAGLEVQGREAMTAGDVRAAALARSELRGVQAELAIAQHSIARARICASSDGTIVAGELRKRIGEVVRLGEPLLELVPEGNWSVELHVPEEAALDLQTGFSGRFACNARPDEVVNCRITHIRPSSEPIEGKNVFVAEAAVDQNPVWMRSGMEGVARIDAGKRRIWWITLHHVVDYLRLTFWL